MGYLGTTAVLAACGPALIVILVLASTWLRPGARAASLLGMRYAVRKNRESLLRALPVSLLVAVILAPLAVGDGMFLMVERNVDRNLSGVDLVLSAPSFVPMGPVEDSGALDADFVDSWAPAMMFDGVASPVKGGVSSGVMTIGADDRIFDTLEAVTRDGRRLEDIPLRNEVYVNERLLEETGASSGDSIRLDISTIGVEGDTLLGYGKEELLRLNLSVAEVIQDSGLGRYREDSLDEVDPICIVSIGMLRDRLDREGEVNKVLVDLDTEHESGSGLDRAADAIHAKISSALSIHDAGYILEDGHVADTVVVTHEIMMFPSDRLESGKEGIDTLSYFVDSVRSDAGEISYSVITGVEDEEKLSFFDPSGPELEMELGPGEIAINNWTSEKLGVSISDTVTLSYRRITGGGSFSTEEAELEVAYVIGIDGTGAERGFLPDIEGVTEIDSCRDWSPGFDIDLDEIGDKDVEYWELYRTTPKGFIRLDEARDHWAVPSGNTTAVVFFGERARVSEDLNASTDLETAGGTLIKVRERALGSSRGLLIFPAMFATFGSMMIAGALLTLAAVDIDLSSRRRREWGALRSIGGKKGHLFIAGIQETIPGLISGLLIGIPSGLLTAAALNAGISSVWSDTVEGSSVPFAFSYNSVFVAVSIGLVASFIASVFAVWTAVRRTPAGNMRGGEAPSFDTKRTRKILTLISSVLLLIGLPVLILWPKGGGAEVSAAFVGGTLLFSAGISVGLFVLISLVKGRGDTSLIVLSNISRRPGKGPLVAGILAVSLSLVLSLNAVGSILKEDLEDDISSYGGGFDYFIETSLPLNGDPDEELEGAGEIFSILTRGTEGGTCSNINAPFPPRLIGVDRDLVGSADFGLSGRDERFDSDDEAWRGLLEITGERIPIMVDSNTLTWIYYEGLGSEFTLEAEDGTEATLFVIGVLEPSVLTGTFVMSRDHLKTLYPSGSSDKLFLARGLDGDKEAQKRSLSRVFEGKGPVIEEVEALARENLDYELSYLYLFRDFLAMGLVVAVVSSVAFTHARALRMRSELFTLRAIGVKMRKARTYLALENMVIFLISVAGALGGSVVSLLLFSPAGGGGEDVIGPLVLFAGLFVVVMTAVSAVSGSVALGRGMKRIRRTKQ